MTWLLGILGYVAALGLVLLLAGGVRRADALHASARRPAPKPVREPLMDPAPRRADVPAPAMRVVR